MHEGATSSFTTKIKEPHSSGHTRVRTSLMDPLTCLSVAGTVVQFVDFTFKILSETRQLYHDGQLSVHEQTSKATDELSRYSKGLKQSIQAGSSRLSENEAELERLCQECGALAEELKERLDKLTVTGKKKIWKSVGQALKSLWSKKELEEIERRLSMYRDAMNSRLLGSLRERVDQIMGTMRQQMTKDQVSKVEVYNHIQQLVANALLDIHASLSRDLQAQTKIITDLIEQGSASPIGKDSILSQAAREIIGVATNPEEAEIYLDIQQKEARLHKSIAEALLDSLRYETILERYEAVSEPHQKTFEWILQPKSNNDAVHWSDFGHWLREGNGIYWITGKAGSGKSTLMKYIYENPKTQEYLHIWAKDTPLYFAEFFFWWSGTEIQRSQEGLLRSLLHDVLSHMPALIPRIFPTQWAARYDAMTNIGRLRPVESWNSRVLYQAFRTLISQTDLPMKLCLFIDGLDEYDGLETDIAKLFKNVVLAPHVKVCASSRPHIPFEDAFATRPKLRVQDLTHGDIQLYIKGRLVEDEMMQKLAAKEPAQCQCLIQEIDDAAQGVFLWVELVVNSLLNGLGNHDQIKDLQKRLKALPPGLDELYDHIVLKIDEIYQDEASRLYQLIAAATEQPDDWKPASLLSVVTLYLAVQQDLFTNKELRESLQNEDLLLERCRETDVFLKTRCGGLLEVQYSANATEISPSMKVSYLHRTVRDYLGAHNTRNELSKRTGGTDEVAFKPNLTIFIAFKFQYEVLIPTDMFAGAPEMGHAEMGQALTYARRIDSDTRIPVSDIVHLFDSFSAVLRWNSMLPIAIQCCLKRYLQAKLKPHHFIEETLLDEEGAIKPLLDYALVPSADSDRFVDPEVVSILVSTGADPNKALGSQTPWQNVLSYLVLNSERLQNSPAQLESWSQIIKILLRSGANSKACCYGPQRVSYGGKSKKEVVTDNLWSASEVVRHAFETMPKVEEELQGLLKRRKGALPASLHPAGSKKRSKCHPQ